MTATPYQNRCMASSASSFTSGENVGLFLLVGTSGVSATAIIGLLSYIAYSAVCIRLDSSRRWRIGGPTEVYFLNQLGWDLVQASGGIMNIKWGIDRAVEPGSYCSAQGAIKHMSDVGSALSTLLISLHTLRVVCFWRVGDSDKETEFTRENVPVRRRCLIHSLVVVACLWCSLGLLVTINVLVDGVQQFYGPTGYWCWIQARYSIQRTGTDFGLMWITIICNIVVYGLLFLYFKGYITTDGCHVKLFRVRDSASFHRLMPLRQVYGLLFYPIVYMLTVLPLSIARYRTFAHHDVPFGVTIFVDCIYLSNGLLNVILFSLTRPYLLPCDPQVPSMVVISEPPPSVAIVGDPCSGGPYEGTSTTPHDWCSNPRVESPTPCSFSESDRSVQEPVEPLEEKVGREE